jgi:hypothetical protein
MKPKPQGQNTFLQHTAGWSQAPHTGPPCSKAKPHLQSTCQSPVLRSRSPLGETSSYCLPLTATHLFCTCALAVPHHSVPLSTSRLHSLCPSKSSFFYSPPFSLSWTSLPDPLSTCTFWFLRADESDQSTISIQINPAGCISWVSRVLGCRGNRKGY